MQSRWCCIDCVSEIDLDTHGRCGTCGSDAVDRIGRTGNRASSDTPAPLSIARATPLAWLAKGILTLRG